MVKTSKGYDGREGRTTQFQKGELCLPVKEPKLEMIRILSVVYVAVCVRVCIQFP